MILQKYLRLVFKTKVNRAFWVSFVFFITCLLLDYGVTNLLSGGNPLYETNTIARWWWQITGPLRFIEIPIWIGVVFTTALLINTKSKFLTLLWLNFLAFQHLLGFITWLPYGTLDFLYQFPEWATGYVISLTSIFLASPITFFQTQVQEHLGSNIVRLLRSVSSIH